VTTQNAIDPVSIREELTGILVRAAGVLPGELDEADDTTLAQLGLDSLAAMELQAVVQDHYGVQIPDDSLEMSLLEITGYVAAQLTVGS
jgi:acyl carrier protein